MAPTLALLLCCAEHMWCAQQPGPGGSFPGLRDFSLSLRLTQALVHVLRVISQVLRVPPKGRTGHCSSGKLLLCQGRVLTVPSAWLLAGSCPWVDNSWTYVAGHVGTLVSISYASICHGMAAPPNLERRESHPLSSLRWRNHCQYCSRAPSSRKKNIQCCHSVHAIMALTGRPESFPESCINFPPGRPGCESEPASLVAEPQSFVGKLRLLVAMQTIWVNHVSDRCPVHSMQPSDEMSHSLSLKLRHDEKGNMASGSVTCAQSPAEQRLVSGEPGELMLR